MLRKLLVKKEDPMDDPDFDPDEAEEENVSGKKKIKKEVV